MRAPWFTSLHVENSMVNLFRFGCARVAARSRGLGCISIVTVALAALVLMAQPRRAHAQKQVYFQVKPVDPNDPKKRGKAPDIEAAVVGVGTGLPAEKFILIQNDAKPPIPPIKALSVRPYVQSSETIAIAVLVEGNNIWIGNESYLPEGTDGRYPGVLNKLVPLIDKLNKVGPPGSLGTIISYHNGVETKLPMGPIAGLVGTVLGNEKDYTGYIGTELTNGVVLALAELKKVTTARKALVILGDGGDTNPTDAKKRLAELRKQAEADRIEIFAAVYQAGLEVEDKVIGNLVPSPITVNSVDSLSAAIDGIVARINDRVYVTFPGHDAKLKAGFTWDGREHEFTLKIDQDEFDPKMLVLAPPWKPPGPGFPWVKAVALGAGGLALVGLLLFVVTRKPAPAPAPVTAAPVAAAPAQPFKTQGVRIDGADGFPMVGWVVALNGPNAFKTYKLQSRATKFGTSPESHVVIPDGYLSANHCEIHASPTGFVLTDLKSTNGTVVNDRRVERHELVDNDLITLGKTNFKFKSIN